MINPYNRKIVRVLLLKEKTLHFYSNIIEFRILLHDKLNDARHNKLNDARHNKLNRINTN